MLFFNLDVLFQLGYVMCVCVCVWCLANVLVRIEWILGCKWQHRKGSSYFQFSRERLAESGFFFSLKPSAPIGKSSLKISAH